MCKIEPQQILHSIGLESGRVATKKGQCIVYTFIESCKVKKNEIIPRNVLLHIFIRLYTNLSICSKTYR